MADSKSVSSEAVVVSARRPVRPANNEFLASRFLFFFFPATSLLGNHEATTTVEECVKGM